MSVKNILIHARDLISKGWTQQTMARNDLGYPVSCHDPYATCYCLSGALLKSCCSFDEKYNTYAYIEDILKNVIDDTIMSWNDTPFRTQQEVVDALNKAIDISE